MEKRHPANDLTLEDQLSQINELKDRRELERAVNLALIYLEKRPNESSLLSTLAHCFILQNKVPQALEYLDKAKKIDPDNPLIVWNFARSYIRRNEFEKAKNLVQKSLTKFPNNIEGIVILGSCFRLLREHEESLMCLNEALGLDSEYTPGLINRGLTFLQKNMKREALDDFDKAYKLAPNSKDIWKIIGDLSVEFGKFDEAEELYKKLITETPNRGDLLGAIGVCRQQQFDYEGAEIFYQRALLLDATQTPVYNNMGILRQKKGDIESAIELFQHAIAKNSNYATAYINLGNALRDKNNIEGAIYSYKSALEINGHILEGYNNLGASLTNYEFRKLDRSFYTIMQSLLTEYCYTRPIDLAKPITSLLKSEPSLIVLLNETRENIASQFSKVVDILDAFPILHTFMRTSIMPEKDLENLFSRIRYIILNHIHALNFTNGLENFMISLSLHNYINEYIYLESEEETEWLSELELTIKRDLMVGKQPKPLMILCLSLYRQISSYDWCSKIKFPKSLKQIEKITVIDPLKEKRIAKQIPLLCDISNDISLQVQDQYENYPYPRWIKSAQPFKQQTVNERIQEMKLSVFSTENYGIDSPKILVAGCGTGQHSIEVAQRFKNSEVFALDLSRVSLAYAKRKSEELELKNISYMQADIMDLGNLKDKYDIISCVGVLHHMKDPYRAWEILCNLLISGGLMQIGLYSKLARQPVIKIQKGLEKNFSKLGKSEIIKFRESIALSDAEQNREILKSNDFYSLSALKDLLFHVHEHTFTIPEISDYLDQLGLKFCGIDNPNLCSAFKSWFKNGNDLYNLKRWNEFENQFPQSFGNMYQFWCQKY